MLLITNEYNALEKALNNYIKVHNLESREYYIEEIISYIISVAIYHKPQCVYGDELGNEYSNFLEDSANGISNQYDDQISDNDIMVNINNSYDMIYNVIDELNNLFRVIVTGLPEKIEDDSVTIINKDGNYYIKSDSTFKFTFHLEELESIIINTDEPYSVYDYRNTFILFGTILENPTILEFKMFIELLCLIDMTNTDNFNITLTSYYIRNSDRYNNVIEELKKLAYKLPNNVVRNFNGWLGDSLNARIIQNDKIYG